MQIFCTIYFLLIYLAYAVSESCAIFKYPFVPLFLPYTFLAAHYHFLPLKYHYSTYKGKCMTTIAYARLYHWNLKLNFTTCVIISRPDIIYFGPFFCSKFRWLNCCMNFLFFDIQLIYTYTSVQSSIVFL